MAFAFRLKIEKENSELTLLEDDTLVAVRYWPEERGSGRAILTAIDGILAEMDMTPEMVDHFELDLNLPETYTSSRIAKTISVTYGFAIAQKKKEP